MLIRAAQARREDRSAEAKPGLLEALHICRRSKDPALLARVLKALGQVERDLGHPVEALKHYEEAAEIYRKADDKLNLAHTVRHLGDIHQEEGRLAAAEAHYHEALEIYRVQAEAPPLDLANAIRGYALLKSFRGEKQAAIALWQEARDLYAGVNVEEGVVESSRRIVQLGGDTKPVAD